MKKFSDISQMLIFWLLLFTCSSVLAASDAYMNITAEVVGNIPGEVEVAGFEDSIEVSEMHHLFTRANGATEHKPLIVTVPMGKSTPKLLEVLDQGLNITELSIKFNRPDSGTGLQDQFYTYTLLNAKLVAAEPVMYDNELVENLQLRSSVRLRFTYQSITHTFEDGGISAVLTVDP